MTEPELLTTLAGIKHFLCPGQAWWLHQQVKGLPDKSVVLEIGTFHGYSAAAMGLACLDTHKKIICVDFNPDFLKQAFAHWSRLSLEGIILGTLLDSERLLDYAACVQWPKFRFAFIDGSHTFEDVVRDYRTVKQLCEPGARIAFHDVIPTWPGVLQAWREVFAPELVDHQFCESIASGVVK